jgi:hypothetical protein
MLIESALDSEYSLCDHNIAVPLQTAHLEWPLQENVIEQSLDKKDTLSRIGKGLGPKTLLNWFEKSKEGTDSKTLGLLHMHIISINTEAEEIVWMVKTLQSVKMM